MNGPAKPRQSAAAGTTVATPPATEPLAVSIAEAAWLLGVGKTTVYAMAQDSRIRAVKAGRRSLVCVASIRAFLAGPPAVVKPLPPAQLQTIPRRPLRNVMRG